MVYNLSIDRNLGSKAEREYVISTNRKHGQPQCVVSSKDLPIDIKPISGLTTWKLNIKNQIRVEKRYSAYDSEKL
jgi:hypothetical protein